MAKRLGNYVLNSMKVAIMGFFWFVLFHVPYGRLPDTPLAGKIVVGAVLWAVWSFMVMIVSGEFDKAKQPCRENSNRKSM